MRARSLWLSLLGGLVLAVGAAGPALGEGADPYIVAPGDTLIGIAIRFGSSVDELMRLNGLRNPDRLSIGQQLLVPVPIAAARVEPTVAQDGDGFHIVGPRETLESIALGHGLSVEDLVEANNLSDPDFLRVGQRLTMPPPRYATVAVADRLHFERDASYLGVPYRTQFDGTPYADSNCGPAALGMLMAYYGKFFPSDSIRRDVNRHTGDWSADGGSSWESLEFAARQRGFSVEGLYQGNSYRRWTFDALMAEVQSGRPAMLLVRYRNLPGHLGSSWWGDHYIPVLGLTVGGDVIYHDSAFYGNEAGAYRTMSKDQLMRAWSTNIAGIQYSAMVIRWQGSGQ